MGFFDWLKNRSENAVVSERTGVSKILVIIAEGGVDKSKRWDPLQTKIKYSESWDVMKEVAEKYCGIKGLYYEDHILRYDKYEDFKDDDPISPDINSDNIDGLSVYQLTTLFPDLAEPFKKVAELVKAKKAGNTKKVLEIMQSDSTEVTKNVPKTVKKDIVKIASDKSKVNAEEKKVEPYVKGDSAVNTNELQIIDQKNVDLNKNEIMELTSTIDRTIESLKNNRQEINRLTFECVSAMTEADDAQRKLSRKGMLSRLIGSLTGSNQTLQNKINSNINIAQYAAQQTLNRIAERHCMTNDLIVALNNKLNVSLLQSKNDYRRIQEAVVKFLKGYRENVNKINEQLTSLKAKVELSDWRADIRVQRFYGKKYSELDTVIKLVCLSRDFYDKTHGDWNSKDLEKLETAMENLGVNEHDTVNYVDCLKTIASNQALKDKLYGDTKLELIDSPSYLLTTNLLKTFDKIDSVVNSYGIGDDQETTYDNLINKCVQKEFPDGLPVDMNCYGFILELLLNLKQTCLPLPAVETKEIEAGVSNGLNIDSVITEISDNNLNSALPQQENDSISVTEQTTHKLSSMQQEDETKTVSLKDADVREKYEIQGLLSIDEQGKTFKDKIIVISNNIECKGTLTFDNCEISYHDCESDDDGQIILIDEAKLKLKHCDIRCSEYSSNSSHKALISSNHSSSIDIVDCDFFACSGLIDETSGNEFSRITIENSRFYNCINLISGVKLEDDLTITNHCYFEFTNKNLLKANLITIEEGTFYLEKTVVTTKKGARNVVENLLIGNDRLHNSMHSDYQRQNYLFVGNGSFYINNCKFSYIRSCLYGVSAVRHCKFEDCISVIESDNSSEGILNIEDKCEFINCIEAIKNGYGSFDEKRKAHIKKCIFKGWNEKAPLMFFSNPCVLEGCEFEDITIHGNHGLIELSGLEGASDKRVTALNVKTCTFKNVCVDSTNIADEGERNNDILNFGQIGHKISHDDYVVFSNCKFVNCKGFLIDRDLKYTYYGTWDIFNSSKDSFYAVSFENCYGIDSEGRAIQ